MNNLNKLEDIVKDVLIRYETCRSDDFELVYAVYRELDFIMATRESFYEVMLNHRKYKLPYFESISRCRRKIQRNHPELCSEKVKKKRLEKTADYIEYNRQ